MARPRQPIDLVTAKSKKHLTKKEIETRKNQEVKAPADAITAPEYLSKKQSADFDKIAHQLIELDIFSNLDCDSLARFIVSRDNYIKFTKIVNSIGADLESIGDLDKATSIQDRAFKQCRAAASDLGLTISSRCKLVIPKKEEQTESKWDKFGAGNRA